MASRSDRVEKIIIIGIPFGLGATGEFRNFITEFRSHWQPIIQAQSEDKVDITSLSEEDRAELEAGNIALDLAWLAWCRLGCSQTCGGLYP